MEAYARNDGAVEFSDATEQFNELLGFLKSPAARALEHGELEREIEVRGREVLRSVMQNHLDERARLERPQPVTGADGLRRTHLRVQSRPLMTVFGPVRVWRTGVSARGEESLFPLDAELNLPPEVQSHGVRERVAVEAARGSFEGAVEAVRRTTGALVSKRQAETLARQAAQDFDAFYQARAPESVRAGEGELVVMSTDGKGIVVRREDLREATRRAAERGGHKLEKRLSKGEKRNRKRMATVAAVYSVAPHVRTVEEVVRELRPIGDAARRRPRPQHKRVWASVAKEPEEVIAELFAEADRRDPQRLCPRVVLVDGQPAQLDNVRRQAREAGVPVTIVLDLIHVLEYLWRASYCFHADGTPEAQDWVTHRLRLVLSGKASDVAAGIRRSATLRDLPASARQAADKCADYLLNNRGYLHYDQYLARGLPIATGVIEGACRHLVKDRMDITGARWSLGGADAVLRLRALRSSGDFDAYWSFHLGRERTRNHLSLYEAGSPPASRPPSPTLRLVSS